jgi:hypothetical protein
MRGVGARFVYTLRSESDPDRQYVGRTFNSNRLQRFVFDPDRLVFDPRYLVPHRLATTN